MLPIPLALAALLAAGCDGNSSTEPNDAHARREASVAVAGREPVDVGGAWTWRETVVLQVPIAFAELFGVEPEGPVTTGRCVNSGEMVLVQQGATFTGTATQTASCVTRGGQVFSPPVFGPTVVISEGIMTGRSLRFVFGVGDVPCIYHAVIADIDDGRATRLRGGGRCIPPGHPQSPLAFLELDLPSGPISPTIEWEATRP
jgi:hypothetical protein